MVDYWPSEELVVNLHHIVQWASAGTNTIVSGYGVKCHATDEVNRLKIIIAAKNSGWGIALKSSTAVGDPIPVLLWGLVKLTAGAAGSTVNYQQTFGAAGLLGDATAMTIHSGPVAWALQSIGAANEGLYFFSP